jgi:integrase
MTAKNLTDASVKRIKAKAARADHWDRQAPGLALRVSPSGARCWSMLYRLHGKLRRDTIGEPPAMTLTQAREEARLSRAEARAGTDPRIRRQRAQEALRRAQAGTFRVLADEYLDLHARKRNRSWPETLRIFDTYVMLHWADRPVAEITRSDVTALLDKVEAGAFRDGRGRKFKGGAVQADAVLAQLRKAFNWHQARNESFVSPVVRGMSRAAPARDRARDRILADDEIRLVWGCAGQAGIFGAFVRLLLLSAQRRENVAGLKRSAVDAEGVWTIDAGDAKNRKAQRVPLPETALALIREQPRIDESDLVFTTSGAVPISGFSKFKRQFDAAILDAMRRQAVERGENPADVKPLPRWTLHDLRRTARSLMSRAGVQSDIAERVLGHLIPGVRGTYDRHSYLLEKREALRKLAGLISVILNPPRDNVVALAG